MLVIRHRKKEMKIPIGTKSVTTLGVTLLGDKTSHPPSPQSLESAAGAGIFWWVHANRKTASVSHLSFLEASRLPQSVKESALWSKEVALYFGVGVFACTAAAAGGADGDGDICCCCKEGCAGSSSSAGA